MTDKNIPKSAQEAGKLPQNILYFARTLRGAGMRLGPASVVSAVEAVETAGLTTRDDFYWTLHSIFVKRREDHPVFDEAFRLFWRSRDLIEKMLQMFSPLATPDARKAQKKAAEARVSEALFSGNAKSKPVARPEIQIDAVMSASQREVLRKKDFAQMSVAELAQARLAMAKFVMPVDLLKTRRFEPSKHVLTIDRRRTMASAMRTGGDLILPKFRKARQIHPPIVVLADISGSMANYSRIFLHFLHALSAERRHVHSFLFGTRLTNVTRQLRMKDPDEAIMEMTKIVDDWSGGTRIGVTLRAFNHQWSRRVLSQGAIVLLITDGLERDCDDILDQEMDRLHRSCKKLIWLNPLLRFDGFEARARGIRTMLHHVDEFRAVHSLDALTDLCHSLSQPSTKHNSPRSWLAALRAA